MKGLTLLSGTERGRLLHELFPEEMPQTVDYLEGLCTTILEDEEQSRQSWRNLEVGFCRFIKILKEVQENIDVNKANICRNSKLFSFLLFAWEWDVFTSYGLMLYVTTQQHPNEKFASMIRILFG